MNLTQGMTDAEIKEAIFSKPFSACTVRGQDDGREAAPGHLAQFP